MKSGKHNRASMYYLLLVVLNSYTFYYGLHGTGNKEPEIVVTSELDVAYLTG